MDTEFAKTSADVEIPVLIVGGGGAGLTCSMLLSHLGIKTLLVSSLPTTSILPKAHVLNQRTMSALPSRSMPRARPPRIWRRWAGMPGLPAPIQISAV